GQRVIFGDSEIAAHREIVALEPNAATRSWALIGQREVFGPMSPISGPRPGPRARRARGGAPRGSLGVDAARTHRSGFRANDPPRGSPPRTSASTGRSPNACGMI